VSTGDFQEALSALLGKDAPNLSPAKPTPSLTRHQRCWVHKTANVLNKVALSVQVNIGS
jgi:hypothetical protein